MVLAIIIFIILIIFFLTPTDSDSSYPHDDFDRPHDNQPPTESHADWVKRDAEEHKRISDQYDRDWAEEYMDEHDEF